MTNTLTEQIVHIQNDLDVVFAEVVKLQKRLEIATKALEDYADEKKWRNATTVINTDYFEYESSMYNLKDSGFEEAQKALKEMAGVK